MSGNETAAELLNSGLSVIPIIMPEKRPTVSWEKYQTKAPIPGELSFNGAMALICGKVSGNVECFDIDTKHDKEGTLKARMKEAFGEEFFLEIQNAVVIQQTISGGFHFIYKCEEIAGNQKLARNKEGEVVLETRGEGGYIVIHPTPGYKLLRGSLSEIPTITAAQRQRLFDSAAMLNEYFQEQKIPTSKKIATITNGLKPWDAYDQGTDVTDLLQKHGWSFVKNHGQQEFWKRPGTSDSAWSGSWHAEKNTFYVYTSSAPPLEAGKAYTPYALLTLFEYAGDFSVSAKELLKQGFGSTEKRITTTNDQGETVTEVLTRIKKLELWLSERYEFRRNTITSRLMYREKNKQWIKCNENDIWRQIQHNIHDLGRGKRGAEVNMPLSDICTILESAFVPDFNPIVHYFEQLPPWDKVDHINNLSKYVITNDLEFWEPQFKKALVRMLACTLGRIVNRIVMTLVSETQELGKSQFIRFLCPPDIRDYYKEEPLLHDKDSEIALSENFIWNLEELDDLNKKQISEMKAIISRESIKQRRAYARYEESMPRIVNFWGSTNKVDFLTDTTNTRWLCFNVVSINHDYNNTQTGVKKIDINKVWAQAYHLYKSGFDYHLSAEDRKKRDVMNQDFETMPEEKQLIIRYFLPGKPGDNISKFMVNHDIKEHLNQNTSAKNRFNEYNIGRSMKQLNFKQEVRKQNNKTVRGYWLTVQNSPMTYDAAAQKAPDLFDNEDLLPF